MAEKKKKEKEEKERGEIIRINIKSYSLHEVGKTSSRIPSAISTCFLNEYCTLNFPSPLRDPNVETMHASDIFRSPNIPPPTLFLFHDFRKEEGEGGDLEWHVNRRHVSEDNTYGRAIAIPRILG